MDFENALISTDRDQHRSFVFIDYRRFLEDCQYLRKVRFFGIQQLIAECNNCSTLYKNFDEAKRILFSLIDHIEFDTRPTLSINLTYDPNVLARGLS